MNCLRWEFLFEIFGHLWIVTQYLPMRGHQLIRLHEGQKELHDWMIVRLGSAAHLPISEMDG